MFFFLIIFKLLISQWNASASYIHTHSRSSHRYTPRIFTYIYFFHYTRLLEKSRRGCASGLWQVLASRHSPTCCFLLNGVGEFCVRQWSFETTAAFSILLLLTLAGWDLPLKGLHSHSVKLGSLGNPVAIFRLKITQSISIFIIWCVLYAIYQLLMLFFWKYNLKN